MNTGFAWLWNETNTRMDWLWGSLLKLGCHNWKESPAFLNITYCSHILEKSTLKKQGGLYGIEINHSVNFVFCISHTLLKQDWNNLISKCPLRNLIVGGGIKEIVRISESCLHSILMSAQSFTTHLLTELKCVLINMWNPHDSLAL